MKFTCCSTLPSLATLNLSFRLSEELYLIESYKKHHIQRNFLFRLHFFKSPLLWRCGRPRPIPESNQLDLELPKRDLRPELLLLLLFPDLRTTNLEIMPKTNWVCQISRQQRGAWIVVYLARQLVLVCLFQGGSVLPVSLIEAARF